jgi:hypothetical protein
VSRRDETDIAVRLFYSNTRPTSSRLLPPQPRSVGFTSKGYRLVGCQPRLVSLNGTLRGRFGGDIDQLIRPLNPGAKDREPLESSDSFGLCIVHHS